MDSRTVGGSAGKIPEIPSQDGILAPPTVSPAEPSSILVRLLERTSHPLALVDIGGRIIRVNEAFANFLGYSISELMNLTLQDITPTAWLEATAEPLGRLRETGKPERYEKEYVRKDGTLVPAEVVVELYRDEADRPRGYFAFITDISERKKAEQALKNSEERYRRLYDEAPVGYHEIDINGIITSVNRTECEMLGFTQEQMVGRPIFDFVAPEARVDARRAVQEKIRGERSLSAIERKYVTQDGREMVLAIEDRLTTDSDGRVLGIRTTMQDITARKQTEAALVASERRARALFEGIEDAIFVHDLEGHILDANPAACRSLGYTRDELLRLTARDIDDPEHALGYADRLQEQMRRGHLSFEGRHRRKDGRLIPVEVNTSMIHFEGDRAVLALVRDISERKALEETRRQLLDARLRSAQELEAKNRALTESETRYRQLTEGSLDAVVVADDQGQIVLFNPAAERTFGYDSSEVIGKPLTILMPPNYRQYHEEGFRRYTATRKSRLVGRTVELTGLRKDGETFPLELSLSAVDVDGCVQFIGAIRDQTERQRMRAMLMQTEKLASIGLLSAGVAHEINNPLAYVGNNLAVLERDLKGILAMLNAYDSARDKLATVAPDVAHEIERLSDELDWCYVRENLDRMLARTRDGVQRVANIVNNLRGLARTAPPKLEETQIQTLLGTAVEMVRGRLKRDKIELEIDDGNVPPIPCVASQINQVLLNMLVNAIQAVEAANRGEGGYIRVALGTRGNELTISICDNGCGIESEHMPRLFDPFFTTKAVGEGTGLGLAITHGIVSGHGGRIEVQSKPGEGTCFTIALPMQQS